jgi:DNA-binding CsgD family transcriptional regulator/GAF domain-containing protein
MRGQTLTDTELLLELVGEAYGFEDLGQFRSGVLEILNRMVPSGWASYNEVSPEPGETFVMAIPEIPEHLVSTFSKLAHENPLLIRIRRTGDGRPYRFSDVIDQQAFHGLALYQEVYRPLGVEHQIAFTLPARSPLVLGIALSRGHEDFSDREVQLLALARPHLMQAYRNAELSSARAAMLTALEAGLDTLGRHVVVLDAHGQVEFATDGARRLLGDPDAMRSGLPEEVRVWVSERRGPRAPAEPLVLQAARGSVLVHLLPSHRSDRREVLLLEDGTGELSVAALRGLGLTARQADTLGWVAIGHSPSQAAAEMGIAPRTVDKHLQHVYAKLGATCLSQATATAWAAVGVERPAGGYRV